MEKLDLMFIEEMKREEKAKNEAEKELNKIKKAFNLSDFAEKVEGMTMKQVERLAKATEIPFELGESSITFETLEFHNTNCLLFFMSDNKVVDIIECEN